MMLPTVDHPVELLRDQKGIYGIGVVHVTETDHRPRNLILRRDCLPESNADCIFGYPILQMITGGFRHGIFCHTLEERHRQVIHHEMLRRVGLDWPPPQSSNGSSERYWSSDVRRQARNRQIYHGLRLNSLSVINRLIGRALEEAADPEAIRVARRFKFQYRYNIYCAIARSPSALQLAVAFPALAFAIFGDPSPLHEPFAFDEEFGDVCDIFDKFHKKFGKEQLELKRIKDEATALVEVGAPLRKIADLTRIPMGFRKIKPGAVGRNLAGLVYDTWDKRLVHAYMPEALPRMNFWLQAIWRSSDLGPNFVEWVAKHLFEIPGSTIQILPALYEIKDWVRACNCRAYRSICASQIQMPRFPSTAW